MGNKVTKVDAASIWDKRYQNGETPCAQETVDKDPVDYTQYPFLYKQSKAKKITGDPDGNPLLMLAEKYLTPPVKKMLAVGSGLAFKEEILLKNGYIEHLTVFESSSSAVDSARERFRQLGLQDKVDMYVGSPINADLVLSSYDVVFVQAAIHHFYNIEEMFELFHRVLKPNGLILFDEYIGPDHHMYESEVCELLDEVNDCLAPSYCWDTMREETRVEFPKATLDWMLEMDPSEGVHSSMILPLTYKYFDVEFRNDYGGTFMRPFFVGILQNFDFDDPKDQTISRLIILMEDILIRYGVIPSYHTMVVGRKKKYPREDLTEEEVNKINYSNWKGGGTQSLPVTKVSEYRVVNYSDENWMNGVSVYDGAMILLKLSRKATRDFSVGEVVVFADGIERSIVDVKQHDQSLIVSLTGPPLNPEAVGYPNVFKLMVSEDGLCQGRLC